MSDYQQIGDDDCDGHDFYEDDDRNCGDCGECEDCWDDMMQECGMQADGGCNLAGTEHCDFECRVRELDDEEL